ncbi:hypothetical protein [Phreatobacter stygius]|uniref:DUF1800 domain-containing protein n=1 Tax=Phreatobacter stygius TaxID=1940610 RepID=A0A4D7AVP5_9HYPH|nr:hypothetical protein [Phreatobacter stygius]QCI63635.1 hypothetical protein E8M01_04920 [Phreatobacter stygius]
MPCTATRLPLVALGLVLWGSSGAWSQPVPACRFNADIVAAADFLLTEPRIERRFWRDRASDDAAFLKIRYAGLSHADGLRLIDELRQRRPPPQRIEELRLAHARPADRATVLDGPIDSATGPVLSASAFRAAILDDDGERLFKALIRRASPQQTPILADALQVQLARGLADLDDATKDRVARRAEAAGFWRFSLEVLAAKSDPSAWLATLKRSPFAPPDAARLAELFAPLWRGYATLNPQAYQRDALPVELRAAAEQLEARRMPETTSIDHVNTLVRLAPRAQFLMTVLNQTGSVRLGSEVAQPLVEDIQAGRLDPAQDDDAVQILIFSGLDRVLGRAQASAQLMSFRSSIGSAPDQTTLIRLERTVARQALRPYLTGNRPALPERPLPLSPDFDWESWSRTAQILRAGTPVPDGSQPIAAELLEAAGRYPEALLAWRHVADREAGRIGAHAMLLALDQRCARLMSPPAPLQEPVYRFEPR